MRIKEGHFIIECAEKYEQNRKLAMKRKTVLILGAILLILAVVIILLPALVSSSKENNAIDILNERYNEDFAMAKSTATNVFFGGAFDLTAQSLKTDIAYDFVVDGDNVTGNYYGENVNIELNELLEQHVDGLVMTNAHIETSEPISYKDADIEHVDLKVMTNGAMTVEKVEELVNVLKAELGDVTIELENLIIEEKEIYDGVIQEVAMYFQLSTITAESFEDIGLQTKKYQY